MAIRTAVNQGGSHRWVRAIAAVACLVISGGGCSGPTGIQAVSAIRVQPSAIALLVPRQTTLRATAVDAAGRVLAMSRVYWSSEDTTIATVSSSGVVTAVTPGRARIAASAEGVTGIAIVTISAVTVAEVVVLPETLTVTPNATGQLRATAYDPSGNVVTGLSAAWGSSEPSVATVSASGTVTGVSPGMATVTAAIAGRVASATIRVATPPEVDIAGCNGGTLNRTVPGNLVVNGDIDGQCTATLRSTSGSIEIRGKIDHASTADLTAATSISIDDQIDGGSQVQVTAGASFSLGNDLTGSTMGTASTLTVWNSSSLTVAGNIQGGVQVKLHSHGSIAIGGQLHDHNTLVLWWAPSFTVSGGIKGGAQAIKQNWGDFPDRY
jgi:Bacterial Ig-like domain (group 2)